jgi:CRP/FNR family transcriptional regulator, anaerobic regulatory protein
MSLHDSMKPQQNCANCPIQYRAICAQCEPNELRQLEEIKYYRSFEAGQPVIWAGDRMDFVASVVTGVAKLTKTMEDGRTQMVGLMLPSDFVGRPGRDTTPFDVTAVTDVLMCCFRKKQFELMMIQTPHIAHRLLAMTLDELDAAREWMLLLGRKTAREKIASLFAILAQRDADLAAPQKTPQRSFDLPLTRAAMADYLGLTLETVSRQISALRQDGVISLQGLRHVIVPDLRRLIVESGAEDSTELHI